MSKVSIMKLLFVASIFSLCMGQFSLITKGDGISVYLFDILVAVYGFWGILVLLLRKKKITISPFFFLLGVFSCISLASLLLQITTYSLEAIFSSSFYLIRWVIYLLAAFVTFNFVQNKLFSELFVFRTLVISALLVSVAGFIQLVVLPDFSVLDPALGWDPHINRLASTFFDPNFTGGYLALVLGLMIVRLFWKQTTFAKFDYFLALTILLALFLTFSRSSWGMFTVIILITGLLKSKPLFFISLILLFSTYVFIPRIQTRLSGITDPADSAAFRLVSWKNTWEIASDNMFLGVGFNTFRYVQAEYGFFESGLYGGNSGGGSDSSFLLVLATTGILGLLFFGLGYFSQNNNYLLPLSLGLFLHSQFVNSIFYPPILFAWLLVWSLNKKTNSI